MKINLLYILLVTFIYFDELLASESQASSYQEIVWKDIKPLINESGNNYFNATTQIFHITVQTPKLFLNGSASEIGSQELSSAPKPAFKIPAGYAYTPGIGAHKFHPYPKTWNIARKICIQEGGHLFILRSTYEEAMIKDYLVNNNIEQIWLGVHELFQDNDWVTVLDEPLKKLDFAPWLKGSPDHMAGFEHCVEYVIRTKVGDGMNDLSCKKTLPFFCKKDK